MGGFGAILYPLVFYYVGYMAILDRDDFLTCKVIKKLEYEAKDESYSDNVRFTMTWNCVMMVVFLICHFSLFSRPDSIDTYQKLGVAFPIMLIAEIIFALINFILIGTSICNDGGHAGAAIVSSLAILIINGAILVGGILYFLGKSKSPDAQVAAVPEERRQLTEN